MQTVKGFKLTKNNEGIVDKDEKPEWRTINRQVVI